MKIKNGRQKGTSILLRCLFALSPLLFAAPVKGQNTVLIEESEPMLEVWVENQTASQPYIAAYMTTDYIEANPGRGPDACFQGIRKKHKPDNRKMRGKV